MFRFFLLFLALFLYVAAGCLGTMITLEEASKRTGLNEKTLRRRIADGSLRAYTFVGTRAIRVDTDDLDKFARRVGGDK